MDNGYPEYFVVYTELERGWGSKVYHVEGYADLATAQATASEVNAMNCLPQVPDYYVVAELSTDLNWLKHHAFVDKRQTSQELKS